MNSVLTHVPGRLGAGQLLVPLPFLSCLSSLSAPRGNRKPSFCFSFKAAAERSVQGFLSVSS